MAKFSLEINIDNDNTWMRTEFSLGMVLKRIGEDIAISNPDFQKMYREHVPIKDAYGNTVGHYKMTP